MKLWSFRGVWGRLPVAALTAIILVTGCIVLPIPTPHGRVLEGTEVNSSDLAFLQVGSTAKEEVIRRLGTPTIVWRDENVLGYRWVRRQGALLWLIGAGYQADWGAADITEEYAFLIKFDPADRFVRAETLPKPETKSFGQFLLDWRDAPHPPQRGGSHSPR